MNRAYFIFALALTITTLAACGIRPGQLQSPSGDKSFPHTYPAKDK